MNDNGIFYGNVVDLPGLGSFVSSTELGISQIAEQAIIRHQEKVARMGLPVPEPSKNVFMEWMTA